MQGFISFLFLLLFFGLRLVSFWTTDHSILQGILTGMVLTLFSISFWWRERVAWYMLVGELFLGGTGHFFELFGVAIRTWLIGLFLLFWTLRVGYKKEWHRFRLPTVVAVPGLVFSGFLLFSIFLGYQNGHDPRLIVQDVIPFSFFLLLFPAKQHLEQVWQSSIYRNLLAVFLFGSALFSLFTLLVFSTGVSLLHGPYYQWYRDVAHGKITDLGAGMYRIVTPEHLLLVPILLFLVAYLLSITKRTRQEWSIVGVASIPFMLNLSRAYLLAFVATLPFLAWRQSLRQWFKISATTLALMILVFINLNFLATSGQSFGLDLLGFRFASIARPDTERSAATRAVLLGPIREKIQNNPLLGEGLGATITFTDPVSKEVITTRQFDWGYLELWTELGLLGTLSYLVFLVTHLFLLIKKIYRDGQLQWQTAGLLTGALSLCVINLTTPALFHMFGILFFVFTMTMTMKDDAFPIPLSGQSHSV